jgi:hypothetical protein
MTLKTDLHMAGYDGDQRVQMQRRMLDAAAAIPGVTAVGYADRLPLSIGGNDSSVYTDSTTEFRPTNSAADAQQFNVSPDYFRAAGTSLLAGRALTFDDDSKAPLVALVNREFARKVLGSFDKPVGSHFNVWGGKHVKIVGVVEDGKYETLTEDQQPAMFYSFQQQPSSAGRVGPSRRNARYYRYLGDGVLRGKQTPARTGHSRGLGCESAQCTRGGAGARLPTTGDWLCGGHDSRHACNPRVVGDCVSGHAEGPVVLGSVILTMLAVGLVAAWIPARHALAVPPMILLRQE